jgi:hypothetical protein
MSRAFVQLAVIRDLQLATDRTCCKIPIALMYPSFHVKARLRW